MATAIVPFRKMQIGKESTKGTLVAATKVLIGDNHLEEVVNTYRSGHPRGVRTSVGGAGVITRQGCNISINTELTAEEVLWFLLTGIKGGVTGSNSGGDYTWTFSPELTTGIPTVDSATVEFVLSDGSTNHYYGEAGYAMTQSFKIDWSADSASDAVKFSASMFARARQSGSPTGSLSPYTREPLVAALSKHYLDTSWAGLGGTQMTGICRSGSIEVNTGLMPDYTGDGRSDKDFVKHSVGLLTARQSIVWEFDSVGASRFGNYRANDIIYIRNQFNGSVVVSANRKVQVDGAWRFVDTPSFSENGEQVLMSASLEAVYDDTGTKSLEFVVLNGLSAV